MKVGEETSRVKVGGNWLGKPVVWKEDQCIMSMFPAYGILEKGAED